MPPQASSPARSIRQRSSGWVATGSSDASWPQYSNSRRGARCGGAVQQLRVVGPEAAEQRQVVRALEHVDRVDLDQPDAVEHAPQRPAVGLAGASAGRRSPAPRAPSGAPGRRRGARAACGGRTASRHPCTGKRVHDRRRAPRGCPLGYRGEAHMTAPAADAAQDRPRRKLYTQLWFWVIVGIVAGIVFGLVAARAGREGQVARRRVHPAHPDDHGARDLRDGGDRHRVARQRHARRRSRAARAGLLPHDDRRRARARPDRGQHRPARLGLRGLADRGGPGQRQGVDRRGRQRPGHRPVPHRQRPPGQPGRAVRGERDPARPGARDPDGDRHLVPGPGPAQADRRRLRPRQSRHLRRDPADHVVRPARRVRRHGVHRRAVRLGVAGQPRAADGHLLGHLRGVRVRDPRRRRAGWRASTSCASSGCSATSC